MIFLDENEIDILAKTQTCVVHCPGASTRNAMSSTIYGKFPEMLEKGITIALASDQGNSSDGLDMCRMAYLAAVLHKEARFSMPVISVEQALEMATINGAKVMGLEDKIGSLEVGKKADMVVHNMKHPESHPPFDPLNNLVLSVHSKSVDTVLIEGRIIVEDGELKTLDAQEIFAKVDAKALDLAKRMGYKLHKNWPVIK
jgi:cytosine/adenosine deaminase-related metal-dependent hydrolase